MTNEEKKGLRHHIVAAGRDILVVGAVISLLATSLAWTLRPYWEPFSRVPVQLATLESQVEAIGLTVARELKPHIVEFEGAGQIVGDRTVNPGDSITVLYFLRRNISCETDVTRLFYNVNTGVTIDAGVFSAVKAPVTEDFTLFKVDIKIPESMPDGQYVYTPIITPVLCGIYESMPVIPTQIFTVVRNG